MAIITILPMAYRCQNCDSLIISLRLGYCATCREPISSDILSTTKQQELIQAELEYKAMRDRVRSQRAEDEEKKRQAATRDDRAWWNVDH